MKTSVVWSPKAKDHYLVILSDCYDRSRDFAVKLDDAVEQLVGNLEQFRDFCPASSQRPVFRKCVILRNYALIYRNYDDMIWIVDVLDNRRKPRY